MKSTNDKIEKILNKYAEYYFDSIEGFGSMHTITKDEAIRQIKQLIKETLQECIEEPTVQVLIQVDNTEYLNGGFVQTSRLLDKLEELLND